MALRKDESLVDGKWQRRYGLQLYELSDKPLNEKIAEYNRIKAMTDSVQRAQQFKQFFSDPDNKTKIKMHVGRLFNGKYGFFLFDDSGKARLSIYLDEDGTPKIEQVE
ncbi:MAG: hypothetical protein KDD94_00085 [Calditrichaeota bacterium]|nr:hypothetical protein [Calditrichota bacterium]